MRAIVYRRLKRFPLPPPRCPERAGRGLSAASVSVTHWAGAVHSGSGSEMSNRLRIIVTGMVAQYPVGGVAWDYLQYAIGFACLGHDVFYHEDTWCWPYHPRHNRMTD